MRRSRRSAAPWALWLLRPRGDAPPITVSGALAKTAPPPTRRCARRSRGLPRELRGSSAHAEMRPSARRARMGRRRLLRPRGDAPPKRRRPRRKPRAPPPTRRCARDPTRDASSPPGSSAHAEMRPVCIPFEHGGPRLLRPRGDAPRLSRAFRACRGAPPPTRRCAVRLSRRPPHAAGSSAHAEMRPPADCGSGRRLWLLRPRGDAPRFRADLSVGVEAPPPTRRCARPAHDRAGASCGSSAHAEMRPRRGRRRSARARLLRPRGDAPFERTASGGLRMAPPPTRRCARRSAATSFESSGSSAHAEMRPRSRSPAPQARGLLRPRGDAPRSIISGRVGGKAPPPTRRCAPAALAEHVAGDGSSAHAEMRPDQGEEHVHEDRLLRPRGDAPVRVRSLPVTATAPPPTRRCAPAALAEHVAGDGSSAHAEMRPASIAASGQRAGLLRPRGDAPCFKRRS